MTTASILLTDMLDGNNNNNNNNNNDDDRSKNCDKSDFRESDDDSEDVLALHHRSLALKEASDLSHGTDSIDALGDVDAVPVPPVIITTKNYLQ